MTQVCKRNVFNTIKMINVLNNVVGLNKQYAPRLVGDVITEMLHSNSPLAVGYRKWKQQQSSVEPIKAVEYGV